MDDLIGTSFSNSLPHNSVPCRIQYPRRIKIVRAIAGHTGELQEMEMQVCPDGMLVKMPKIVAAAPNLRTYIIKVCICSASACDLDGV